MRWNRAPARACMELPIRAHCNAGLPTRMPVIVLLAGLLLTVAGAAETPETRAGLDWWAFQPVVLPPVPAVAESGSPIDAFILQRLRLQGLEPAPPADRRFLIRRVSYDLTGLPPGLAEVEAFIADSSPEAYERLVDRLLASEHFGERWARHWLDVARFAETNGYERDELKPNLWKYRDWVIDAFNADMPYDQFVREQLAGDEIQQPDERSVIATGMLRAGTWNDEPNDPHEYQYERLEDMVDVVSTAFLGLTVKCARCHDHKFDPIPQRDYYRFAAAFWPGAIAPRDRALMGGPSAGELGFPEVFGWTDLRRDPAPLQLLTNGDPQRPAGAVEAGNLSLVPELDAPSPPPPPEAKTSRRRLHLAAFITDTRNPLTARVMMNRVWQHLFGQGIVGTPDNFGFKSDIPSHPELLDWLAADFVAGEWRIKRMLRQILLSDTYRQSSLHPLQAIHAGRDPDNRLLWRANRRRLDAESLRDALLASTGELDPRLGGPSFYPVMQPEVLEGFSRKADAWTPSPPASRMRRSVYMISKRHLLLPMMTAFDFPNSERPCGKREVTTVAPQALALLNNAFVHQRGEHLARVAASSAAGTEARLRLIWSSILGRQPNASEVDKAARHYAAQLAWFGEAASDRSAAEREQLALASVCLVLLNTNEFLYVD